MKFVRLFVVCSVLFPLSFSHAGAVKSMSSDSIVEGSGDSAVYESTVTCSGRKTVVIRREGKRGDWCAKELSDFCKRDKIKLAGKVCGMSFVRSLKEAQAKGPVAVETVVETPVKAAVEEEVIEDAVFETVEESAPVEPVVEEVQQPEVSAQPVVTKQDAETIQHEKDQLELEERKLKLQQQKLELRKQELDLQKQELELKRELEADKKPKASPVKKTAPKPVAKPAPAVKKPEPKKEQSTVPLLFRTPTEEE